ncbi:MAG: sterol-binding protein [Thermoleophilia bacterium]|nr:sterol-binding protein [Thermoleophilia bacterium]
MATIAPNTSPTTTRARRVRAAGAAAPTTRPTAPAVGNRAVDTVFLGAPRKAGGMSVKQRFATLEERFKPDAAKGVDVRFQFQLSGDGGGDWYVEIKDGKITVKDGSGPNPTATLKASAKDYKKIADGEMNKMWAFVRGKLKVDGDKDALGKFDSYFRKP